MVMKMDSEETSINEVLVSRISFDERVIAVAALADSLRREIYRYVVLQGTPVSRFEVASRFDIAHHIAKFHLDKLVKDGLLEADYKRPNGQRGGPGAGRPTKYYQRSSREISVSLPDRRYDLVGHIFARAFMGVLAHDGLDLKDALRSAATSLGISMSREMRQSDGNGDSETVATELLMSALGKWGFEPHQNEGVIVLANCPFCDLASAYPEIICEMNLDLIQGFVTSLGDPVWNPRLSPSENRCCIVLSESRTLPSGEMCS